MEVLKISNAALKKAITVISSGGVVICPTDTVYGFLADATNKKAVEKIYKIKKRPKLKPLPIFVKDLKMANSFAKINNEQVKLLKKFWPGKYTFVLKRKPKIRLYGIDKSTIALRIPKYNFLNNLLKKINRPLVQTSVNISSQPPLNNISAIMNQFNKSDILIINASNIKKNKSSEILDLTGNKIKVIRR